MRMSVRIFIKPCSLSKISNSTYQSSRTYGFYKYGLVDTYVGHGNGKSGQTPLALCQMAQKTATANQVSIRNDDEHESLRCNFKLKFFFTLTGFTSLLYLNCSITDNVRKETGIPSGDT